MHYVNIVRHVYKKKEEALSIDFLVDFVGMGRFELPTSRPPDERSNRAEPHPDKSEMQIYKESFNSNKKARNFARVSMI